MPLVFPGSDRNRGDEPNDPYELTFRDGKRIVPPYLVDLMAGIDTVRYTYSEAVDRANSRLVSNQINQAADGIVSEHIAGLNR